jgi:hypothetical protein
LTCAAPSGSGLHRPARLFPAPAANNDAMPTEPAGRNQSADPPNPDAPGDSPPPDAKTASANFPVANPNSPYAASVRCDTKHALASLVRRAAAGANPDIAFGVPVGVPNFPYGKLAR